MNCDHNHRYGSRRHVLLRVGRVSRRNPKSRYVCVRCGRRFTGRPQFAKVIN